MSMTDQEAIRIVSRFASVCNISNPEYSFIDKAGEKFLAIYVSSINPIYTKNLALVKDELDPDSAFKGRVFLKRKSPANWLNSIECQLLQSLLSESLTIGKATLASDFHKEVIPFVGGVERQILNRANHIIFGRRGAGKSTLLLRAAMRAQQEGVNFAWIAMQQYQGRKDLLVVPQVLYELTEALADTAQFDSSAVEQMRSYILRLEDKGVDQTLDDIKAVLPTLARPFLAFVRSTGPFYILIDDLHLLHPFLQPLVLSAIYSFSRGNNVYLKITSIENLTNLYSEPQQEGLQTPGDAQVIRLDYNLVNPEAALEHIHRIISSFVRYVGIPSLSRIISRKDVLERLVWTCAGVPRDALYIFNNAISKALAQKRKAVAVTDVNMAAAESMIEKEHNLSDDVEDTQNDVRKVIDDIKQFCLREKRCNAFQVRIDTDNSKFRMIHKVSDLRFIHILHPGITPEKAGEKYEVYLLDYAFYTGFRKAPSVREILPTLRLPSAKELRKLERYPYEERI